ncbi:MAG: hypothetical protein ACYCOU_02200 [Sulfobacillus sp.]
MAASKRPTLAESGIDKLFQPSPPPAPARPAAAPVTSAASTGTWEATHRRRTFHCENAVWERLTAWCHETGTSHSAAIAQALEEFLADRGR